QLQHLQVALQRAVLAADAVDQRKDDVDLVPAHPGLEREIAVAVRARLRSFQNARAPLGSDEAPVFRDADRNHLDARLRRRVGHRARGEDRDVMLRAAPAEEEEYVHLPTGMLDRRYFRSSSRQRIPPPKMNAVSLNTLSTPLLTKISGVRGFSFRTTYSPYRRRCGFGSRRLPKSNASPVIV